MKKSGIKTLLEELEFDNKYLNRKLKEIDKIKRQIREIPSDKEARPLKEIVANETKRLKKFIAKKEKVEDLIESLCQPYRTLMYLRYMNFLTFDQVAREMNYSTKRIYQLHNEGLDLLEKNVQNSSNISKD